MRQKMRDDHLARDTSAQLKLITEAYATGISFEIDQALARVVDIRRMEKTGLQDLLDEFSDRDEPD